MSNGKNGKGAKWWDNVPPIVPSQGTFCKDQTRLLLGGISDSTYYKIRSLGLLKFSRITPGGMVVHTREHITAYESYLNLDAVVNKSSRLKLQQRRLGIN